jgi:hypothetical protein
MCGPFATPAERFHLQCLNSISQFDESSRSWKEFGAKVGQDAEGIHIDSESICDPGEALYLLFGIKLCFVTDYVVDPIAYR